MSSSQKAELDDWQHEAGLKTKVKLAPPVVLLAVNGMPVPNVALIAAGDNRVAAASAGSAAPATISVVATTNLIFIDVSP